MKYQTILCIILSTVLVVGVEAVFPKFKYEIQRSISNSTFYVSIILAINAALELVFKRYRIPFPQGIIILLVGFTFGMTARFWGVVTLGNIFKVPPTYMMIFALPSFVMKTCFSVDAHTYFRSWSQILIISVPGVIIMGCIIGAILLGMMTEEYWHMTGAIHFGLLCTPLYPFQLVHNLKELGQHTKYVVNLLEGESIFGLCTVMVSWQLTIDIYSEKLTSCGQIVYKLAWLIIGGIIFGFITGKLLCWSVDGLYSSNKNIILWVIGAIHLDYYICSEFLDMSGMLALIVTAFLFSIQRPSLATKIDVFLGYFWEFTSSVVTSTLLYTNGVWASIILLDDTAPKEYGLVIVTTCVTIITRFVVIIVIGPILMRLGYGISWNNLLILAWGGQKSIIPVCLVNLAIAEALIADRRFGYQMYIHLTGLLFFSLLIQVTLTPYVLKVLGIAEVSTTRRRNMNICVKHIQFHQATSINCLKMEKFLADCNWPKVYKATVMRNPYEDTIEGTSSDTDFYEYRTTVCPDCEKEVVEDPSPEVLQEMTREARIRILKAQRISFLRQYENGMLSRNGRRILLAAVHIATDSEEALLDIQALRNLFTKKELSYKCYVCFVVMLRQRVIAARAPNSYIKRKCWHIGKSLAFKVFMFLVILANSVTVVYELSADIQVFSSEHIAFAVLNEIFMIIYVLEFFILFYGYSRVSVRNGLKIYFSSWWNIFDFILLVVGSVDFVIILLELSGSEKKAFKTRIVTLMRVLRFLRLTQPLYPKLRTYLDSKIDDRVAFAYEIGKSFIDAQVEVMDKLPHIVDNKTIRDDMIVKLEQDRETIIFELSMVQKKRPWITITVKTKQAMRATLFNMEEAVNELKVAGWMDDFEHEKMNQSLAERLKYVYSIRTVQPSEPKMIFKEVSWMGNNEELMNYLFSNVKCITFDTGDFVCRERHLSDGIFIIITGLLKLTYIPRRQILDRLQKYGILPVADYLANSSYTERMQDYLVCGNSIGELSTITSRPYNCNIVAETPSQLFLIPRDIIREAFIQDMDPIHGLECRIWKSVAIRIALSILLDVPAYNMMTIERIKMALESSFIPKLGTQRSFIVNDNIEDVILVEGVAKDSNTGEYFVAPCYIPRTVKQLDINFLESENGVETKLLIVPLKDVDDYELIFGGNDTEMAMKASSSKCLLHTVQMKESISKRRRSRVTHFSQMATPDRRRRSTQLVIPLTVVESDSESVLEDIELGNTRYSSTRSSVAERKSSGPRY